MVAFTEFDSYVAYFLERGADMCILDDEKTNPLHCAIGCASVCITNSNLRSTVPNV